jgi:hypothetical protein
MDLQKRILQCNRCTKRILYKIQVGDITVAGLKAALFNLNRQIGCLEKEITKPDVTEAIKAAKEVIDSSKINNILDGKTFIKKKTKQKIKSKKLYNNSLESYSKWRDNASLEGYHVPGTASEQIRYTKGFKKRI